MLVACESELADVEVGKLAKPRPHREGGCILHAAILNEKSKMVHIPFVFLPTEGVDIRVEFEGLGFSKFNTQWIEQLLHHGFEDFIAKPIHSVLEAGLLAVLAVTVVTLNKHNLLADKVYFVGRHESKHVAKSRIRSRSG